MAEKRVLIIGGAFQGKLAFAQKQFGQYRCIARGELAVLSQAEDIMIVGFHNWMREWILQKEDWRERIAVLQQQSSWVVIADEIGSGIVPMAREDREWREETGRALCLLAQEADAVYRVFAGIAQRIK